MGFSVTSCDRPRGRYEPEGYAVFTQQAGSLTDSIGDFTCRLPEYG